MTIKYKCRRFTWGWIALHLEKEKDALEIPRIERAALVGGTIGTGIVRTIEVATVVSFITIV
jgi:hypothetical protein